jgi:dUTP pyrophosphatase
MVKILIKKLNSKVKLPSYKTDGSSGMDLMAFLDKPISILPQKSELIPTGLSIAIPDNTEVQIRPRSGLAVKNNISVLNTPGTVDSDYHGDKEFIVNNEDRIAQMVLMPIIKANFEVVENLPETIRGKGGFGSTGK